MSHVLLVAHGSRHPQARVVVQGIAAAMRRLLPGDLVTTCALDVESPSPRAALLDLTRRGAGRVRLVPLLFAPGFHLRVDLPSQVAAAAIAAGWVPTHDDPVFATVAPPLIDIDDRDGTELLLDALDTRAGAALAGADSLVLLATGSSDPDALAAVDALARLWGARHSLSAGSAFASGPGVRPADAVRVSRAAGAERVLAGSLFLAPGLLPTRAAQAAADAGATVSPVLGAAPPLVELIARRVTASPSLHDQRQG